jgi:hypothetical protein
MAVTLRNVKGTELTFNEVDGNFQSLYYSSSLNGNNLIFYFTASTISHSILLPSGGVSFPYTGSAEITGSLTVSGSFNVMRRDNDLRLTNTTVTISGSAVPIAGAVVESGSYAYFAGIEKIPQIFDISASYVPVIGNINTSSNDIFGVAVLEDRAIMTYRDGTGGKSNSITITSESIEHRGIDDTNLHTRFRNGSDDTLLEIYNNSDVLFTGSFGLVQYANTASFVAYILPPGEKVSFTGSAIRQETSASGVFSSVGLLNGIINVEGIPGNLLANQHNIFIQSGSSDQLQQYIGSADATAIGSGKIFIASTDLNTTGSAGQFTLNIEVLKDSLYPYGAISLRNANLTTGEGIVFGTIASQEGFFINNSYTNTTASLFTVFDNVNNNNKIFEIQPSYIILSQVSASYNYADDTDAGNNGVPLGGLYHTSGSVKIRLV